MNKTINIVCALGSGLLAAALFLGLALVRIEVLDDSVSAYNARPVHYGVPDSPHAYRDRFVKITYVQPLLYVEVQAPTLNAARSAIRAIGGPVYQVLREGHGKYPLRVFRTEADYELYQRQNASVQGI